MYSVVFVLTVLSTPADDFGPLLKYAIKYYGSAYVITVYIAAYAGATALYYSVATKLQLWFDRKRTEGTEYIRSFHDAAGHSEGRWRFLILKIRGDEAFFVINAAQFISRPFIALRHVIDSKSSKHFFWPTFRKSLILITILMILAGCEDITETFKTPGNFVMFSSTAAILSLVIVAIRAQLIVLVSAVILILQSFGGAEMLIGNDFYDVEVDTSPDKFIAEQIPLDPSTHSSALRHSVYAHPDCVPEIVKFVSVWLNTVSDKPSIH